MISSMHTPPRLLLLGYGNVARALLPLLASRSDWLEQSLGIVPLISGIGSRRTGFFVHPTGLTASSLCAREGSDYYPVYESDKKDAGLTSGIDPIHLFQQTGIACENALTFIQAGHAAGANVLIELTTMNPQSGEPALSHIHQALTIGMDVITANKGPIAHAGEELQTLARSRHVQLRFESTVMDGLPLLNLAEFTLPVVDIRGFRGLLNTTSSIVLRQMEQGKSLEEAIYLAQQIGVAEADPWHDLDGWDAAMKTTILANALLKARLTPPMIQRTGIRDLSQADVIAAAQAGTPVRLVSSAQIIEGKTVATVRPERLQPADPLHSSKDGGIVTLETEAMGNISLIEHDTNVKQTAYGVLSDLIIVLRTTHIK